MTAGEIIWRIKSIISSYIEQVRIIFKIIPGIDTAFSAGLSNITFGFTLPALKHKPILFDKDQLLAFAADKTLHKADELLAHRFTYFNHENIYFGEQINWHYDHNARINSPRGLSAYIDYRDFKKSGDCKEVWEPNRHHHLVILARAYKISGDNKYAIEICKQLQSWLKDNPYGKGMNWRSPLELGVRLINWVIALELIKDSSEFSGDLKNSVFHSIYLHCWDVSRKISKGSSANNHLVGEVAGLFVATSWLPGMKNSTKMRDEAKSILCNEIQRQTYADGCTREQAFGYEFFVLQFYIICGLIGEWSNNEFPDEYWLTIQKMVSFVSEQAKGCEQLTMFGDRDDGYVLDLGNKPDDVDALLSIATLLLGGDKKHYKINKLTETVYWLFGVEGINIIKGLLSMERSEPLASKSFSESGYYLLQYGSKSEGNEISILFDAAELGYGSIAAHGHADALSFALRVNGYDVLVDPGTFDYFSYPAWRKYFRSTAAHNTVEIDGLNQSELLGPFLWGKRANCKCLEWQVSESGGSIFAEHDGYMHLADPVLHQRRLSLDGDSRIINIVDVIKCKNKHTVKLHFHLSEHSTIKDVKNNQVTIEVNSKVITFNFEKACSVDLVCGQETPILGWVSRRYHHKTPINTIVVTMLVSGDVNIKTKINIEN